jgi:UDP-N-acetylglucosamine 2-epimerase (non-hydrolysing)
MKKTFLVIFGTRPEAIKMVPLVNELKKYDESIQLRICVTGQHREMLDQVLNLFNIRPDFDLDIMKQGQDLFDITTRVLIGMRDVIRQVQPSLVLVHGDTTTSTAAALAAFYENIPIGHVEAGLRTNNYLSPWPEEMNRQITARLASFHFAPTLTSKENLIKENIPESRVIVTGNTVIDTLFLVLDILKNDIDLQQKLSRDLIKRGYEITNDNSKKIVLITGHRRENFGDGFLNICKALRTLAMKYTDVDFVYPMHLNPNVRLPIEKIFSNGKTKNMFFIEPLEYFMFIYLMNKSYIILTDSGGIQEEAPSLGKPVLVMRDTTERPESLTAGTVKLVGTNYDNIVNTVSDLLDNKLSYDKMSKAENPYGNGTASKKIIKFLNSAV